MEILNYSAEPLNKLIAWLPRNLQAERVIFFPDACPGHSPLPTGTVVLTKQKDWRQFAVSDCGCGMLLLRSEKPREAFENEFWDQVYNELRENKGKLGDLGSGNHFLEALSCGDDDFLYFLIHTGSRKESQHVDHLIRQAEAFDRKFEEVCDWAKNNRMKIAALLEQYFGPLQQIVDRNHNHFEETDDGVIIRKGAVKIKPGECAVIPSNLNGPIVLVKATDKVQETLFSLNHGTGRVLSRAEAKLPAENFNFDQLRSTMYIPEMISNASLKTEVPFCYRNLDDCMKLIEELAIIEKRFRPIAYLGRI